MVMMRRLIIDIMIKFMKSNGLNIQNQKLTKKLWKNSNVNVRFVTMPQKDSINHPIYRIPTPIKYKISKPTQ